MSVVLVIATAVSVLSQARGGDSWRLEEPADGVVLVYDDNGQWGGPSMGTSHQVNPTYQTRKTIDLSIVPADLWPKVRAARVRVFFAIQDYSWATPGIQYDGLDEEFEVVINGHVHRYPTSGGFRARAKAEDKLDWQWTDFVIPVSELRRGPNEVIFRKAEDPTKDHYDDYIYVGIDNTVEHGHSAVSFDGGQTWTEQQLNAIKARGEYMVRLVLITRDTTATANWVPGPDQTPGPDGEVRGPGKISDRVGVIGLVEVPGRPETGRAVLKPGAKATVWLDSRLIDPLEPIAAMVRFLGAAPQVKWLGDDGQVLVAEQSLSTGRLTSRVTTPRVVPRRLLLSAEEDPCSLVSLTLEFGRNYLPEPVIDMCPPVAKSPPQRAEAGMPRCRRSGTTILVGDGLLEAVFSASQRLRLSALRTGWSRRPLISRDAEVAAAQLFAVEIDGRRATCEDFPLRETKVTQTGFVAHTAPTRGIGAVFGCRAEGGGKLRFSLEFRNFASQAVRVKVLFPLLAAVQSDYYLYPYAGGIIADVPTYLRVGYGENLA
ncbi:MAG: hypothetical protein H5T86_08485, partial [Armatimonadetes bacterium]|nr:hypothetical protein [Armatimonadota bacterium]